MKITTDFRANIQLDPAENYISFHETNAWKAGNPLLHTASPNQIPSKTGNRYL